MESSPISSARQPLPDLSGPKVAVALPGETTPELSAPGETRLLARRLIVGSLLTALVLAVALAGLFAIFGAPVPFAGAPAPTKVMLPNDFLYQQQRHLSCEFASVHIATTMVGKPISEYAFDDVVGLNEDPHLGYRGNINGDWGNTDDYGVYNEPLHAALATFGIQSNDFYAEGDRSVLKKEIDAGRPTVVWLAMRGDVDSFYQYTADGERYQLTQWMHVMVVYGYDAQNVYLTDPGTAVYRVYSWDDFMAMWNVMDGMGLSVYR